MDNTAFELALAFTLPTEGGYVDDNYDKGGATNHGVTQVEYDVYRDTQKLGHQDVRLITDTETRSVYEDLYWPPGKCDQLPPTLAICHFDWCVNHGVHGAMVTLQECLGVEADGLWGPATKAAVDGAGPLFYLNYNNTRRQWYRDRVSQKPDQQRFLDGWLARVDHLDAYVADIT